MIREELLKIVEENLEIKFDETDFDKNISDLDIDSIDLLDLIMSIEDKYEIEFSDEELDDIKKFDDIVELIEKKNK